MTEKTEEALKAADNADEKVTKALKKAEEADKKAEEAKLMAEKAAEHAIRARSESLEWWIAIAVFLLNVVALIIMGVSGFHINMAHYLSLFVTGAIAAIATIRRYRTIVPPTN